MRPAQSRRPREGARTAFVDEPAWPKEYQFEGDAGSARAARPRGGRQHAGREEESVQRLVFYEEPEEETAEPDPEAAVPAKKPFGGRLGAWLRSRRKAKADKAFTNSYGADDAPVEDAGPRAALYEGKMGRSHRRSQKLQEESRGHRSRTIDFESAAGTRRPSHAVFGIAVAICVVFSIAFIYGPARTYYQQLREHDRLEAEYAAVTERNENIQRQIDELSSETGIEDRARTEFGWVKIGDHSVSVSGLDHKTEAEVSGNVLSSDIKPPETWYSGLLDPLFGV